MQTSSILARVHTRELRADVEHGSRDDTFETERLVDLVAQRAQVTSADNLDGALSATARRVVAGAAPTQGVSPRGHRRSWLGTSYRRASSA